MMGRTTVTGIDRDAGTSDDTLASWIDDCANDSYANIGVSRLSDEFEHVTFNGRTVYRDVCVPERAGAMWLSNEPQTVYMHPRLYEQLKAALQQEIGSIAAGDYLFRDGDFSAPPPGTLSVPALVTLTTLCAFEWLRHRKQAVAEAEASGDYSGLIAEFVEWLRGLLKVWRASVGSAP